MAGWLNGAAYTSRRISNDIIEFSNEELAKWFRPQIIKVILELKKTGTIEALDELIQLTPSGLFEMMRIKGLGGKKLAVIWTKAKIDTLEDLLKACKANKISKLPGFGKKTEENIIHSIENYNDDKDRFHFAFVSDDANELVSILQKDFKGKPISLCGEIRRQSLTVPGIEILAGIGAVKISSPAFKKKVIISSATKEMTVGHTLDEIPVTVYHVDPSIFFLELFKRTGNEKHIQKLLPKLRSKKYVSEESIYKAAGMNFILPEMREDVAEWDFKADPGELIKPEDIKGVVHNHTTYSDGVDTLKNFVLACKKKGYEYTVISDHSKNAYYAGGLKEEKVYRQLEEIDKLSKEVKPFRIFKSIECDILINGDLDYDDDLLSEFDLVIVSVHQLLKMDEKKATARLIKAIENPFTTILGHMTGRQLLIRPGYPVNFKKVIDACAANNVVIEINANPYRLDMDWSHIPYAIKKRVMISINPDAHSIREIDNIKWGVAAARKGGLTKAMTWNAMGLKKLITWLSKKRSGTYAWSA